ncbi:MAG: glycoside hydrolase family 38 C-terminal domain-containing protein [Candidatus Hodarchaeales archaeon]
MQKPISKPLKHVYITPHTHWDREWYLPFQKFRFKLVQLIDELIEKIEEYNYSFTFDGQTIILEDYFEIRPEKKKRLLQLIRDKKIVVGPNYILPDIWLTGSESLIRNIEYSHELAKKYNIPQMDIVYFPDSFGFSKTIPQLFGDLTDFKTLMLWRGVPAEINTTIFSWKSSEYSKPSMLTLYLPFGYGNAASLPSENVQELKNAIESLVENLESFSPLPVYLLHNGTDHKFPDYTLPKTLSRIDIPSIELHLGLLPDYVNKTLELIEETGYTPYEYIGELRTGHRANLLSSTYSSRLWIKIWNQKVEDLLVHYAEPINTYLWVYFSKDYPSQYLQTAWKWFLQNQAHDSICGCSTDFTHEEMKFRYSWAQSLSEATIDDSFTYLDKSLQHKDTPSFLVFNPTNCNEIPLMVKIEVSSKIRMNSIVLDNQNFDIQQLQESSDKIFEMTIGAFKFRTMMKMFPGRKLMDFYINDFEVFESESKTCEIILLVGERPVGELDINSLKSSVNQMVDKKKYKQYHVLITKETKRNYVAMIPLKAWSFSELKLSTKKITSANGSLEVTKNSVKNKYYEIKFNKDGSFNVFDKKTKTNYTGHYFEDWGDQGDEYTFGRLGPEYTKATDVKRKVIIKGPIYCEIKQSMRLLVYNKIDEKKRVGKKKIEIVTKFRFYRDIARIDMTTELRNTAQDHRLRICFNLPFKTSHTITSTHFGTIKREGDPVIRDDDLERMSGIQPQKRFIRVEDPASESALTLMNVGLPEVELVNKDCLAITILRCIGWLSKSDIPERPEVAGPVVPTPGAQELYQKYILEYSLITHSKDQPLSFSYDQSEAFSLVPRSLMLYCVIPQELLHPLLDISSPDIKISSLRVRDNKFLVTLFNLSDKAVETFFQIPARFTKITPIKIDGSYKGECSVVKKQGTLYFNPHEIQMIIFQK